MAKPISAQRVVITSFLVDLSDLVLNVAVAVMSGSVVMISQALQGGADLLTSGFLLLGVRRSRRRSNKQYRFGYGRELFFWVLMAGVSTFILTATLSFYLGLQRLLHPQPIHDVGWALAVLLVGITTNTYALSLSWGRLRSSSDHPQLWKRLFASGFIETKATLILDLMGSTASLFGLIALGIFAITGDLRYDGLGAMVVGVGTGILAIALIAEVKGLIVGRGAPDGIEKLIVETAQDITGVRQIRAVKTMFSGSNELLVNLEVRFAPGLKTSAIEKVTDEIRHQVKRQVPTVGHIQIEVES